MARPSRKTPIDLALRRKIAAHLATNYETTTLNALKFVPDTITEWGKLKILDGGDLIGSQNLHSRRSHEHDKTFVKPYSSLLPVRSLRSIQTIPNSPERRALILAAIAPIKPTLPDEFRMPSYTDLGPIEVVDASTIQCVVGRVYDRRVWTIIERGTAIQTFNTVAAA
ncbi:hypothetical protein BD779DRAFT_1469003 [Infundibulicybe gibba]|nr:hypothetical protein BD779DRAFT_1469003 [Infundibulicybe gibba]